MHDSEIGGRYDGGTAWEEGKRRAVGVTKTRREFSEAMQKIEKTCLFGENSLGPLES